VPAAILPIGLPATLRLAADAVRAGELIAFPTDTVYGIGGDLDQAAAIAALYALKGRQREKALPVLLASAAQLAQVARDVPAPVWRLVEAFWPGALTIVVPRRSTVSTLVGIESSTIGVRVPAHRGLLRVLETVRAPLVSSSANLAGQPSARDAHDVARTLGAGLRLILDGGALPPSAPSTVIDMTGEVPRILRQGQVPASEIARVLGYSPLLAAS
jgi:tRNA threonylcarbamoyl adenosine modification protein (Sua5/YciO/YrdC/YwlC family)